MRILKITSKKLFLNFPQLQLQNTHDLSHTKNKQNLIFLNETTTKCLKKCNVRTNDTYKGKFNLNITPIFQLLYARNNYKNKTGF